ncbi:MAG TPA: hypothetical protein VHS81_02065 [Caulobacteraceae bacterium]|nr:hypothetical protein [Caulobacteraceae bacterium]
MAVVIDEVQVEAVESQAQSGGQGHAQPKPAAHPPLDPNELALVMRKRDQRLARLWAD